MSKILDYLKENGNKTFEEFPFNEIDCAIACLFSYADFLKCTPSLVKSMQTGFIKIRELERENILLELSKKYLLPNLYVRFLKTLFKCSRFMNCEVGYIDQELDLNVEIQYFALTLKLEKHFIIAYRGTDNNLIGFKEDFNLSTLSTIPSHEKSLNYAKKMIKKMNPNSKCYICGHSKGGHLAYYAYFNLGPRTKKKITAVYNFDGPGFENDPYNYDEFNKKVFKFCPVNDIVGIIFDNSKNILVVSTKARSFSAHEMLTWELDETLTKFLLKKRFLLRTEALQMAFSIWIKYVNLETRKYVVDTLFELLATDDSLTVGQTIRNLYNNTHNYFLKYKELDKKKAKKASKVIRSFIFIYIYIVLNFGEALENKDNLENINVINNFLIELKENNL